MRCLAAVAMFAACTIPLEPIQPGVAHVHLHDRDGVPVAASPVLFHGADGQPVATILTTDAGLATGPMEPGGMVSYASPLVRDQLVTRGGLQPDDRVRDGVEPDFVEPDRLSIVVATPGVPSHARLCHVEVACGDRVLAARGSPGAEIALDLPASCVKPGSATLYTLVRATDERSETVAYAELAVAPGARVTVPAWRTDFTDSTTTIIGLDPDLVRYRLEAEVMIGEAPIALALLDGDGPATTVSPTIRFPAGLPGASRYRFDAVFATGELAVEQQLPAGTPFVLGPTDLPPRVTEMSFGVDATRAIVSFTTERPIDGPVTIETVLVTPTASWRLVMPGPTVQLPALEITPFLPYLPVDELSLDRLAVSYTHGAATMTTAQLRP